MLTILDYMSRFLMEIIRWNETNYEHLIQKYFKSVENNPLAA